MSRTVICHLYNEEYLLPAWLKHHKQIFEHGVLIDYHSTDKSVEICLDICPHWKVIPSRNKCFDAQAVDQEVMDIERDVQGWRMCLNVTEFLTGDISLLSDTHEHTQWRVPCVALVGQEWGEQATMDHTLLDHARWGIHYEHDFNLRAARSIHNHVVTYDVGRHFWDYNTTEMCVAWVGFWPWNAQTVARKLQIQTQIPNTDKQMQRGVHHLFTEAALHEWCAASWRPKCVDMSSLIQAHQRKLREHVHPPQI